MCPPEVPEQFLERSTPTVAEGEDHGAIAHRSKEAITPVGLGSKGMAVYPGFGNPELYAATPLGLTSLGILAV